MRPFFIVFALIFAGLTVVQGQLIVPQFSNVDALISLLPEFVNEFEHIFPQLTNLFTSIEIQSFKSRIIELILDEIVHQGNLSTLINRFRPMFDEWLNGKLHRKRDVLSQFFDQFNGLFSPSQIETLKSRVIEVIFSQFASNFDLPTLKNQLRIVLEEYFGSNLQGRADIDVLIQQIIGTTTSALPGVIIGLMGGK